MLTSQARSRSDDVATFYDTRQGQHTAALLNRRLRSLVPSFQGRRFLGIGYPLPYLPADATISISARLNHPQTRLNGTLPPTVHDCIVDSGRLPFDNLSMETVLVVHGLEFTRSASEFLRAIWRVMTDDGLMILVVPNRSGCWAHMDSTPFGHGSPFSGRQLTRLLEQEMFRIECHTGALMAPSAMLRIGNGTFMEHVGRKTGYPCAGVHVVTARKNIYAGLPLRQEEALAPLKGRLAEPA
ncbi:methyltransferase [Gluconobacter morbifer]|uniref:Putative methyltransferase n=1 Tax=Gluconobacter morbifer G707 TaxID=1088869 RepID=G6XKU9_9PROT|nr:methyltransferase [Gluconobacter morbifer]EHH67662.1 putative methyltransferase [Gluconobacter morbifer G707]